MRAARSLPMPGIARRAGSSSVDTGCGQVAMVSAAVRYARTLNALSPLISSRSAICARTCETILLSTRQPVALEREIEDAGASRRERAADGLARRWRTVAEEAPAAARAADLGGRGTGCPGARDEIVDRGRGHARSQPLAIVPLLGNRLAHAVPIALFQRPAHRDGSVTDALEAIEDVPIAIDVPFHDLPVVGAGKMRLTGVAQHDASFELGQIHAQRDAAHSVGIELDGGESAIERRAVVLQSRGHVDGSRFDIHCDLQQTFRVVVQALPLRERGAHGDVERGG